MNSGSVQDDLNRLPGLGGSLTGPKCCDTLTIEDLRRVQLLKIRWFPPLDRFFGPVSQVELDEPVPLREILIRLTAEQEELAPFTRFSPEDRQPHGLMVWRAGKVLGLDDLLLAGDEVEMMIMVAGG